MAAYHPVSGLDTLQSGITNLRKSKLMTVPEFKNMFWAIERHHNDLKLAHLTGKAKDLQDQAIRDTKFYNILVKMLCEVKEKKSVEQRSGLQRVYTWYMANKHVLYCGPRFGKEILKKEAQDLLHKATTPRPPSRAKSAIVRPTSGSVVQVSSRSSRQRLGVPQKSAGHRAKHNTPRIGQTANKNISSEPKFILGFETPAGYKRQEETDVELNSLDYDLQLAINEDELTYKEDPNVVNSAISPISRPKTAVSVTFTPLKEQSTNQQEQVRPIPGKAVHSIPSLVNPHTVLANELAPKDVDEIQQYSKPSIKARIDSGKIPQYSRTNHLQAWKHFNNERSYGQDIVGKLNFVGRSGTAADVRYTAHSHGDMPEVYTNDLVKHYAQHINDLPPSHVREDEENVFVQQTLEQFYETADSIIPSPRLSYQRAKSAPPKRASRHVTIKEKEPKMQTASKDSVGGVQKLGHQLEEAHLNDEELIVPPPVKTTGVKLDTVINIIDSVSEDMTYFKEKVTVEAQSGFKQPSATDMPDHNEQMSELPEEIGAVVREIMSPSTQTEEVLRGPENTPRPFSSPLRSRTVIVREDTASEGVRRAKIRCSSASVVDWRGKIQPETVRYKWSKTRFGGHTYLKKWPQRNLRSAGSTSAGKRPKTAPTTPRDKWKTAKDSDKNTKAVGAATHNTMLVDQDDVDHMMTIQHLLGEDRAGSYDSLDSFDEEFWRRIRKSTESLPTETPTLEFLSFITPNAALLSDRRSQSESPWPQAADDPDYQPAREEGRISQPTEIKVELPSFNEEALNIAVAEEFENQTGREGDNDQYISPVTPRSPSVSKEVNLVTADPKDSHLEVSSVPPGGRSPTPAHLRSLPIQDLSASEPWQFSLEHDLQPQDKKKGHFSDVHLEAEEPGSDSHSAMTTRVERSAGRMPSRNNHNASVQMLAFSRRFSEALRRAPPLRTPPSIPTPQTSAKKPTRRNNQIFLELEHHARRTKSPRNFMQKVHNLRSMESSRPESMASTFSNDTIIGQSLQVCRLPVSSRGRTSLISADSDFDIQNPFFSREQSSLHAINENHDNFQMEKQVSFSDLRHISGSYASKPMTAPSSGFISGLGQSEDLNLHRNATFTSIGSRQNGNRHMHNDSARTISSSRSLAHIGRPIAQVSQIPDPDDLLKAVQVQKEASAAVDIQRLFRGYVARNMYKNLLSEERVKKEEEGRAAIRIQSLYRGHLIRKNEIYNRPPLNPELVTWSKDVSKIKANNAAKRQQKIENLSNEISTNHRDANSKISVIGPHVEIYDIYHPKQTGPTKKELNQAATKIQKVIRGWLIRRKMEKLARKAQWYGSNFPKMVKEYKITIKKVQQQHGVDKAKAPFSIKQMNDYIDTRRRYESVFEKKAFGGELERGDIESFFRECDLYPSQLEIEEAMDVTMHGQANKRDRQGLKKKELLDMIFYIYVPPATGLEGIRQSTWLSPIINGQEARKLLGSEFVEPAPLAPCAKLVINAKREQRLKEQAQKDEEKRKAEEQRREALKQSNEDPTKAKKVTVVSPDKS